MMKALSKKLLRNRWVFRLIGIGIFILILLKIDLRQAWEVLHTILPQYLALSLLIQAVALGVTAVRWQLIMHRMGIAIPFSLSFIYQLIGTAAALVTPGQLGEFVKVLYLRGHGHPALEAVLSVVIDRLFDLLLLLLFGFIALVSLFGLSVQQVTWVVFSLGILCVAAAVYARKRQALSRWVAIALVNLSPKSYKDSVQRSADRLALHIGDLSPRFLLICSLLSLVNYTLLVLRIYALALAVHMQVDFGYFVMVVPLLRLVGLIPISVSGVGTRDISVIYLFARVGIHQETSLIFSMLGFLTLVFQGIVGLMIWWRFPLDWSKDDRSIKHVHTT